jgi:hypothetical protein
MEALVRRGFPLSVPSPRAVSVPLSLPASSLARWLAAAQTRAPAKPPRLLVAKPLHWDRAGSAPSPVLYDLSLEDASATLLQSSADISSRGWPRRGRGEVGDSGRPESRVALAVPSGKDRLEQLVVGTVPRPGADGRGVKSAAVRSRPSERRALSRGAAAL